MARFLLLLVQLKRLQFPRLLILPHNVAISSCWCRCRSIATTAASTRSLMLLKFIVVVQWLVCSGGERLLKIFGLVSGRLAKGWGRIGKVFDSRRLDWIELDDVVVYLVTVSVLFK